MGDPKFQLERVPGALVSSEEILFDMRRAAKLAGTPAISQRLYSEFGQYDPSTAARRFGSWNKAITAAGLQIANEINISADRLFENILLLWQHYGRQPRLAELDLPPSLISGGPYKRRFGSWMTSLSKFIDYANTQDGQPFDPAETLGGHKTGRDPNLRLRFRVMKRDNFSCRACGSSPALTPGLELHIDHVIPWSLGGETIEENLQTLCLRCNLGKSNVL